MVSVAILSGFLFGEELRDGCEEEDAIDAE
jgi:hypothetical protein